MTREMTNAALLREIRTLFDPGLGRDSSDRLRNAEATLT